MKRIEMTEEGFLLNHFNARQLKISLLNIVRSSLNNLVKIGVLKHKECREIEFFIDKIIYKGDKK